MADFSVYPNAIDGYAQMPLVVDSITRVDAVTVNRLRSAIVNIENELGILPSSQNYDTVRDRLDFIEASLLSILSGTTLLESDAAPTAILSTTAIGFQEANATETDYISVVGFREADFSITVNNLASITDLRVRVIYSLLTSPLDFSVSPADWNILPVSEITSSFNELDAYTLNIVPSAYPNFSSLPGSIGIKTNISGLNMKLLIWSETGSSVGSDFDCNAIRRV